VVGAVSPFRIGARAVRRLHRNRGLTLQAMRNYRSVVSVCIGQGSAPKSPRGPGRLWNRGLGGP
jgi:hypothetical protein